MDLLIRAGHALRRHYWLFALVIHPFLIGIMPLLRSNEMLQHMDRLQPEMYGLYYDKSWIIPSRPIDLSDGQWYQFRQFLPLLFVGAIVFVAMRRAIDAASRSVLGGSRLPALLFYAATSMAFGYYLFGARLVFPLVVFLINFAISEYLRGHWLNPVLTWTFNVVVLVTADFYGGYKFQTFVGPFSRELAWKLDSLGGGPLGWHIYFKILLCKLISYNLDLYYHYRDGRDGGEQQQQQQQHARQQKLSELETALRQGKPVDEHRWRHENCPRVSSEFNMLNAFVYCFYVPLLIAGPICSFKAFLSFVYDAPQREYPWRQVAKKAVHIATYAVALEFLLTIIYFVSVSEHRLWRDDNHTFEAVGMSPMRGHEVGAMGITVLTFTFMKFVIIWRLFRFWAVADGVSPPENIANCIFSSYTVSMFWRAWHRSLYSWILTYLYKPLGGSKHKVRNAVIIFFFIAIWHDLWMRWIAWAALNCVLTAVEVFFAQVVSRSSIVTRLKKLPYYHVIHLYALTLNMGAVLVANTALLYGFEDTFNFVRRSFFSPGCWGSYLCLFGIMVINIDRVIVKRQKEERDAKLKSGSPVM